MEEIKATKAKNHAPVLGQNYLKPAIVKQGVIHCHVYSLCLGSQKSGKLVKGYNERIVTVSGWLIKTL